MGASSVTGVGPGSADKKGHKGSEHLYVGVDKIVGTRIVLAGQVTLSGGTATVTFPTTLSGADADYIVLASATSHAYGSSLTTTGFTANGTGSQVVSYIVVRVNNATVEVN